MRELARPTGALDLKIARIHKLAQRFNINEDNGCWEWESQNSHGYGLLKIARRTIGAHRMMYELTTGKVVDPALHIDHLCRNRACVNPNHLEPVTQKENLRRGLLLLTHCPKGHPLSGDNLMPSALKKNKRKCKQCSHKATRNYAVRERANKRVPNRHDATYDSATGTHLCCGSRAEFRHKVNCNQEMQREFFK